jgi:hypothetical protein
MHRTRSRKNHPSTASCLSLVVLGKHGPMRMYMSQFHTTPWTLKPTLNTKRKRRMHGFVCTAKQGESTPQGSGPRPQFRRRDKLKQG